MDFLFFVSALFLLVILFGLKWGELKKGRVFVSKKVLERTDGRLKVLFSRFLDVYKSLSFVYSKIPSFYKEFKTSAKKYFRRMRDKIAFRIIKALNINNIKEIDKDRNSTSLFLQSISEEKSKSNGSVGEDKNKEL